MVATVPRLLRLLALLQTQPSRTAAALADQLGVTTRTIRVDIQRLRSLGYQVDADRGLGGGYRLRTAPTHPVPHRYRHLPPLNERLMTFSSPRQIVPGRP